MSINFASVKLYSCRASLANFGKQKRRSCLERSRKGLESIVILASRWFFPFFRYTDNLHDKNW